MLSLVPPRVQIYSVSPPNPIVGNSTTLRSRSTFARPSQIIQTWWERDGRNITGGDYNGEDTSELTIKSVVRADVGNYTCHMKNAIGTGQSAPARLIVRGNTLYSQICTQYTGCLIRSHLNVSELYASHKFEAATAARIIACFSS